MLRGFDHEAYSHLAQASIRMEEGKSVRFSGSSQSLEEELPPVSYNGVFFLIGMMVILFIGAMTQGDFSRTLRLMGWRDPVTKAYTIMLTTPIFFEMLFHPLDRLVKDHPRVRALLHNLHRHAPYLIITGLVMLLMRIENVFDVPFNEWLGYDLTPIVYSIEGNIVPDIQEALRTGWMDTAMVTVYVGLYALLHVGCIFGFSLSGNTEMVKKFTFTWCGVYLAALPFYLFVPVNEVWVTSSLHCDLYGWNEASGILYTNCDDTSGYIHAIASINNCFPSLHNAFAWALPFLFWKTGHKRAGNLTAIFASLVTLSTVYLAIHWLTDIAAGILLAWIITHYAVRINYTIQPSLKITDVEWIDKEATIESE
ncbi:MAG: phosphatase PAP2 family protein [Candidatus Poseidoniaceae archaeon]|nr:phosphatase PAP2 family protein [Candidatus Poseidoniaceae archaeon]